MTLDPVNPDAAGPISITFHLLEPFDATEMRKLQDADENEIITLPWTNATIRCRAATARAWFAEAEIKEDA